MYPNNYVTLINKKIGKILWKNRSHGVLFTH